MQYQGGKSRIASHIVAKIREMYPTATEIWEPFCGGGAVTLALAKAGFKVHASDSHEDLILMWQALMRGETKPFADVTEAEYAALKTAAPSARRGFVDFAGSFGAALEATRTPSRRRRYIHISSTPAYRVLKRSWTAKNQEPTT